MFANSIDVDTMVEIIVEGLAVATPRPTRAGRGPATPGVTNGTAATRERRWRSFVRLGRRQRLVVPLRPAFTAAVAFGPSLHKE
jgi:hypothetical protein